jgi:AAA domain
VTAPIGPWKSLVKVPVVYVDGEMPAEDMKIRMYLLGITSENFTLLNHELLALRTETQCDINLMNPATQRAITALCVYKKARVLILDNLSTLSSGLKENDNDEWDKVKGWLLHLRRLGITVIILDHQGKNYEHRGASRKEDNVTWVIKLTNLKKRGDGFVGAKFRSDFEKNRNDPAGYQSIEWSYAYDKQTHILTCSGLVLDDDTDLKSRGGRPVTHSDDFMLKPLQDVCPNKLRKDHWWKKLGGEKVIIRKTFDNRVKTLLNAGKVSQDGGSFTYRAIYLTQPAQDVVVCGVRGVSTHVG